MSSSVASWRLDRLSAAAREAAELASVGAGLSLSAWMTRLINDTSALEGVTLRESSTVVEFARKSLAATTATEPTKAEPVLPPGPNAIPGATMLPVTAIVAANLGTRSGENVPDDLSADIAKRGVRQALLVRPAAGAENRFELICGHRRWRAAQRANLAQVPALVRSLDDAHALLASLAENLPRSDLSPIEEAQAYFRLMTQGAVDVSAITQASGRDRQYIIRRMRLLGLPSRLRQLIASGAISADHADLLLDATNPEGLADAIVAERLSVEGAKQRLGATRSKEAGA